MCSLMSSRVFWTSVLFLVNHAIIINCKSRQASFGLPKLIRCTCDRVGTKAMSCIYAIKASSCILCCHCVAIHWIVAWQCDMIQAGWNVVEWCYLIMYINLLWLHWQYTMRDGLPDAGKRAYLTLLGINILLAVLCTPVLSPFDRPAPSFVWHKCWWAH